jgi:hypothetical protein
MNRLLRVLLVLIFALATLAFAFTAVGLWKVLLGV